MHSVMNVNYVIRIILIMFTIFIISTHLKNHLVYHVVRKIIKMN